MKDFNVSMIGCKVPYKRSRSRQHYTSKGKGKKAFSSEQEAYRFISKHRLHLMKPYLCRVCCKYHIGHYNTMNADNDINYNYNA